MRYWNIIQMLMNLYFLVDSQPTYEVLKFNIFSKFVNFIFIPSLPMRYWNDFVVPVPLPSDLFPAYLWGIEIKKKSSHDVFDVNSQPTYEVLKLHYHTERWGKRVDSQPTYEVLKFANLILSTCSFFTFPAYLWGIEIQFLVMLLELEFFIPSLPMRYWNEDNTAMLIDYSTFPAYLWGIEICSHGKNKW